MKVRVLLLTQWFDPEPTSKGMVFARALVQLGFAVEVVTGFPNYPGGRIYDGYRIRLIQREQHGGVEVTRLPLYPDHGKSALKRMLNYVSFAAAALVYGLFRARRADVIYAYHPPLTVGISASLIRFFRRIPVVYDIQDMWPDTLRATGMLNSPFALAIVGRACQWVYRRVDHIVVLSPGFKKVLAQRGVPEKKIDVIFNWADAAALTAPKGTLASSFPDGGQFRILFAGNMGKAQALGAVLDAAALLLQRQSPVCFVLLGSGIEIDYLKEQVSTRALHNVMILPAVPMNQVGTFLAAADALLVHLKRDPLFEITIPSKTQAYMAVGKPLLMAVDGDAAQLVLAAGAGVVSRSEDPASLAAAAEKLAAMSAGQRDEMGHNARRFYDGELSLPVGAAKFGAIFERLASNAR